MQQPTNTGQVRSEINVTPLVDVVLVLLIIFMVVTPMLQKGPPVKLPVTSDPPKKPDDKSQLMVAVSQAKEVWIEKDRVAEGAFATRLRELYERNPNSAIVVKADARLTYGDVKRVVLDIKEAGFTSVGLITSKRESE